MDFGVPQGSVLGPKKMCACIPNLLVILFSGMGSHHSYADDMQLYNFYDNGSFQQ